MSEDACGDLRQQLLANLKTIQDNFADYIECIQKELQKKEVNLGRLKSYLLRLPCYSDHQNNIMLLPTKKAALNKATTIYEVFIMLHEYTSFLNYHIYEKLVSNFQIDEGQECFQYPAKLIDYIQKHSISEFIEIHPALSNYTDGTKELVLILDIKSTSQLSKVVDINHSIADLMKLDKSALLIHSISEGSVTVTFLIPSFVAETIFTGTDIFTQDQRKRYLRLSILQLKCNGYEYNFEEGN